MEVEMWPVVTSDLEEWLKRKEWQRSVERWQGEVERWRQEVERWQRNVESRLTVAAPD